MSDLISRDDAIKAFGLSEKTRKYGGDHSGYATMMKYEIQDVLENLPSAEAKWIPVSEKLPNTTEQVLISVCDDHGDKPYYYTCVGWKCEKYWISDNDYVFGAVIAWQPLPTPYREDKKE